jgi:hypothetical protein
LLGDGIFMNINNTSNLSVHALVVTFLMGSVPLVPPILGTLLVSMAALVCLYAMYEMAG